jgi:endonuclease-3 related protein
MPHDRLGELIRPAGYFNIKARRLKNLIDWMVRDYGGDVQRMNRVPMAAMREQLLAVSGVGPETADSILLYALRQPSFVVDTYTCRIVVRHGLLSPPIEYEELQSLFGDHLPADVAMFNEFHALLVRVGKEHCKPTKARCEGCPLERFPHDAEAN